MLAQDTCIILHGKATMSYIYIIAHVKKIALITYPLGQ